MNKYKCNTYIYVYKYVFYSYTNINMYIYTYIDIRWVNVTPIFDNMKKITYRQAAIDSSMPSEFKKCN